MAVASAATPSTAPTAPTVRTTAAGGARLTGGWTAARYRNLTTVSPLPASSSWAVGVGGGRWEVGGWRLEVGG